jgi:hypothetical protein
MGSKLRIFLAEPKQQKVYRVAMVYVALVLPHGKAVDG